MGVKDNLLRLFNRILGRNQNQLQIQEPIQSADNESIIKPIYAQENYIDLGLAEDEIASFSTDEVLDANSAVSQEKLKHNLGVLIKKAKAEGKVDKFLLIREDDYFPHDWEWRVLSKNTNMENVSTPLSQELRKEYALRQAGIDEYDKHFGIKIPKANSEQIAKAIANVDRNLGTFVFPSRFRSTKHFTVNTPLEATGNYNFVYADRKYIIIDSMDEFLNSGYAYSISYHDAYLDVTHEGLPISEDAIVLIHDNNYEGIMADENVAKELLQRKIIRYKGDTALAIDMVLTEQGVLPSQIGTRFAEYDQETVNILENSIKSLSDEHGLFFDRSHKGSGEIGHFTSYYDLQNTEYQEAYSESIEFLIKKFPEHKEALERYLILGKGTPDIIHQIGIDDLLSAIKEYNEMVRQRAYENYSDYKNDRDTITPTMHIQFTQMVSVINDFYKDVPFDSTYDGKEGIETAVRQFFHGDSVKEQQDAAKLVWEQLRPRIAEKIEKQTNANISEKKPKGLEQDISIDMR